MSSFTTYRPTLPERQLKVLVRSERPCFLQTCHTPQLRTAETLNRHHAATLAAAPRPSLTHPAQSPRA
jgi:hypothetical protein